MPITSCLHRSAQLTPQQPAMLCAERVRTFEELRTRVGRLAGGLRSLGIGPGDRLAILALNSDRYLEFLLACSWLGAVFNPLNTRWSAPELDYGLGDSQSRLLAVDDQFLALAARLRETCAGVEHCVYLGDGPCPAGMLSFEDLIGSAAFTDDARVPGSAIAGLFYTGGTTGVARGVALTHENLMSSAIGSLASGDILAPGPILHVAPLFHLAGIWPWLIQLATGGTHVILPGFDPAQIVANINDLEIANLFLVPTMVQRLLEHLAATGDELPTLRRMMYAGSPIPEAVLDELQAVLSHVELCQVYGMTELSPVATVLLPRDHAGQHRRSAGRPAVHETVRVVDTGDKDCLPGQVGEIIAAGPNVMTGYWNKPEETAAALRGGWMHTGDAGFLDEEGFLYVVDRLKDVIVTGGENVYSGEVENAITSHPAVAACAVIGVPDGQWGERVHAVLVLVEGAALDLGELREHVAARIARYKAPRSMETRQALPLSAAGKVLKRELRRELKEMEDAR